MAEVDNTEPRRNSTDVADSSHNNTGGSTGIRSHNSKASRPTAFHPTSADASRNSSSHRATRPNHRATAPNHHANKRALRVASCGHVDSVRTKLHKAAIRW